MLHVNTKSLSLATLGLLIAVSACAESDKPATNNSSESPSIGDQVAHAKQDLATRLDVDSNVIEAESVLSVQWRSGALGCPKLGMSSTMVITPGVLILLMVDGEPYRYHGALNRMPFFCPADRAEAPAMGQGNEVM